MLNVFLRRSPGGVRPSSGSSTHGAPLVRSHGKADEAKARPNPAATRPTIIAWVPQTWIASPHPELARIKLSDPHNRIRP